mmetsp:Transcript_18138/g.18374  ORF Transcript_18138/g.18374 Transcript_18138/m.18374 type:complete len:177 (-) Transcript_18138:533-1063(-)
MSKAESLPDDIKWHFIGPLQSNKAAPLVRRVGTKLACVETVATLKLAKKLDSAVSNLESDEEEKFKLNIFLQVNTSGEESKSGLKPEEVAPLATVICDQCPNLRVKGLMTIGETGDMGCFDILMQCRDNLVKECGMNNLELSMGMSGDFEQAISRGATNVRVGSTIFGARDYAASK